MVLSLDVSHGALGEQAPSERSLEEWPAEPVGGEIDGRPGADVGGPRESEHGPRIQRPPPRQERAERYYGVGGNGGENILEGGEDGDQRVERDGREGFERMDEVGHSNTATAMTAIPSARPIHPIPSLVFPFTEMAPGATDRAPASRWRICVTWGPIFGCSAMTVTSACTSLWPAASTARLACFKSSSESAPCQRGSESGNIVPMSPSPAAPSRASSPFKGPAANGTPMTGRSVRDAANPGRAADSPAPAMTTLNPWPLAPDTSLAVCSGWRCAEDTWNSYETPALLSTSKAGSILGLSLSDPTRISTSGIRPLRR